MQNVIFLTYNNKLNLLLILVPPDLLNPKFMKNIIDTTENFDIINNETTGHEKQKKPVKAKNTETVLETANLSNLETNQNNSELKYKTVISPDGIHSTKVPIYHGNTIYETHDRLAHHPRDGYKRFWAKDQVFARDLHPYLLKGWDYVSGVEPVVAGARENGSAYYHYLIEIDDYKYEMYEKQRKALNNINIDNDDLEKDQYRPTEHRGKVNFGHIRS